MSAPTNSKLDRELNLKALVLFAAALTGVVLAMAALMWAMSGALRSRLAGQDPPRPILIEARIQPLPPEPRLQAKPEDDLRQMRREEDAALSTFGWVDQASGVARVPIDTAIELLVSQPSQLPPAADGESQ